MITRLAERFKTVSYREKRRLFTLIPPQMSYQTIRARFGCSNDFILESRKFQAESEVIDEPPAKIGKRMPEVLREKVVAFYRDPANCRISSSIKDVRHGPDGDQSKRWLSYNVGELYHMFCEQNFGVRIGRASFFSLRPEDCVTVGSKASHNVCVCTHHQNPKLMLAGLPTEVNYKSLLNESVCDINSMKCMLSKCQNCRGVESAILSLRNSFSSVIDEVTFRQWSTGARVELVTRVETIDSYFTELSLQLDQLKEHHFVAEFQKKWIANRIANLQDGEVCAKLDFSENYAHVCQDEAQGFHWNNIQTTVHPIALHVRIRGRLEFRGLCAISDCLQHNTITVYAILKILNRYLDEDNDLRHTKRIVYVSDGCARQYKNKKNFLNLSLHEQDFGRTAEWAFHATSHGKCECDGLGAAAKSMARRASLQGYEILTSFKFYEFLSGASKKVTYFWLSSLDVAAISEDLEARFLMAKQIPTCRSYHYFVPICPGRLKCYRVAGVEDDAFISGQSTLTEYSKLCPGMFVAIVYDKRWYISKIVEMSEEDIKNREIVSSSMTQRADSNIFSWPSRLDVCHVVEANILCIITEPIALDRRRCSTYTITDTDFKRVCEKYRQWQSNNT
jgi:hypothetical protein